MRILVTAATAIELMPAREVWEVLRYQTDTPLTMECIETGIGATATAYHTLKALSAAADKPYDLSINMGIAGSFSSSLPIGTVVRVASDCFGDSGIQTASGFQSLFDAQLLNANSFPFKSEKLTPPPLSPEWESLLASLPVAEGVTVQRLVTDALTKMIPTVETMEGAAFFYVCMMEEIPCLALRAVSNMAGERDKEKWNIPLSINNLRTFFFLLKSMYNVVQSGHR